MYTSPSETKQDLKAVGVVLLIKYEVKVAENLQAAVIAVEILFPNQQLTVRKINYN